MATAGVEYLAETYPVTTYKGLYLWFDPPGQPGAPRERRVFQTGMYESDLAALRTFAEMLGDQQVIWSSTHDTYQAARARLAAGELEAIAPPRQIPPPPTLQDPDFEATHVTARIKIDPSSILIQLSGPDGSDCGDVMVELWGNQAQVLIWDSRILAEGDDPKKVILHSFPAPPEDQPEPSATEMAGHYPTCPGYYGQPTCCCNEIALQIRLSDDP